MRCLDIKSLLIVQSNDEIFTVLIHKLLADDKGHRVYCEFQIAFFTFVNAEAKDESCLAPVANFRFPQANHRIAAFIIQQFVKVRRNSTVKFDIHGLVPRYTAFTSKAC